MQLEREADPPPQQPVEVSLAVVVGHGFTLDCIQQLGLSGIDVSRPVDWPLKILKQPDISARQALPHFFQAYDELRLARQDASQFDLLREVMASQENEGSRPEVEARHFLTLAYRFFHSVLSKAPIEHWRWLHWFRSYTHVLLTTVSFNYDCLLERVLYLVGRKPHCIPGPVDPGVIRVFKPHGSANFDLVGGSIPGTRSYPLSVYGHMNNFPLRIVRSVDWSDPPFEALTVLPYERNPYSNYQWVLPGYSIFGSLASQLTHCVFVGLSYHPADRAEIDHFLYSTPTSCRIIVADPAPPPDFLAAIEATGRKLHLWRDGPENLPGT